MAINRTHDPAATSWVASANANDADFPIQNLPFAEFRRIGSQEGFRGGVAIGESVLDLACVASLGLLSGLASEAAAACAAPTLDRFLGMGTSAWAALREGLFDLLREKSSDAEADAVVRSCLYPLSDIEYAVPTSVGDYTDFYTSEHHAVNIGKLFGFDRPSPNFYTLPIAYHGRSSTIGVSGQRVPRPKGQIRLDGQTQPSYEACRKLDYELELGVFVGPGNARGARIPLLRAEEHIFGMCILNDWSARDIQAWELQPLGPFNAKNFATTISPWIVTLEALEPFRAPLHRDSGAVPLLPYLDDERMRASGAFDVQLEVWLETSKTRQSAGKPTRLSSTSFRHQYWTVAQMLTHHTDGGCAMRSGDVFGTGTISGPTAEEAGALMELTKGGAIPIEVGDGERRSFLADGDAVIVRGWCSRPGFRRIGFGECRGEVAPANTD